MVLDWANKRGYEWEFAQAGEVGIIRASAGEVAAALAAKHQGVLERDVWGKAMTAQPLIDTLDGVAREKTERLAEKMPGPFGSLVCQLKDQGWSIVSPVMWTLPGMMAKLSRLVDAMSMHFEYDDSSDWLRFEIFEKGELVELYHYGSAFEDDDEELDDDQEQDVDDDFGEHEAKVITQITPAPPDLDVKDSGLRFMFMSRLRKLAGEDILGGSEFLDATLRSHGAYLPPYEFLPPPFGPDRADLTESGVLGTPSANDFQQVNFVHMLPPLVAAEL